MIRKIHVIGAGLAGMAASAYLRQHAFKGEITIYEASTHIGGRAASFPLFNRFVDDNHLLLKANKNVLTLLDIIDSKDNLISVRPGLRFEKKSLGELVDLAILSILNTNPNECAKSLLFKTLVKAAMAPFPVMVKDNFSLAFMEPFIKFARRQNISIVYNANCIGLESDNLYFTKKTLHLLDDEKVIFALPYDAMQKICVNLPQIVFNPITNVHFLLKEKQNTLKDFLGLVGGIGHWYKLRGNILSVTISNSDKPSDDTIREIWCEAKEIFDITGEYSDIKTVVRKRATITQSKQNLALRDDALKILDNQKIFYAGDWTAREFPATMEAAVYSGFKAAKQVI